MQAPWIRAALAAITAFALIGAAQAQSLKPWKHGMVQAKGDAGIVLMAAHKGFAKAQGLDLDIQQFTGDALALKALIAGELDSYEGSPGGPMLAASRGADVKIVGCYWPGATYGIYTRPDIASVKDLAGKTLAISSPGALPDLIARGILQSAGVPLGDVKFALMGSDADRMRAVSAGVADAGAASLEFSGSTEKMKIKLLVNAIEAVPNFLRFCTYVSGKTIAANKDNVARYLAAQMNGTQYALDHRDEAIALSHELAKIDKADPRPDNLFDIVVKYKAVDPSMPIPREKLAWMQDLLIKTGNMKTANDLAKITDDGPRTAALALVKKPTKVSDAGPWAR
jgi:NitT/TauT family transport system substrate-binding protein